jgi:hypothetical protein
MIVYDPALRITAQKAREHVYFNDLPDSLKRHGNDMT